MIQAIRSYGPESLDYNTIVHSLASRLDDAEPTTAASVMEALQDVQSKGPAAFASMLASADVSVTARRMLSAQFPDEVGHACSRCVLIGLLLAV